MIFLFRSGQVVRRAASVAKLSVEFRWKLRPLSGGKVMILGTGLDVARIDRVARALERRPGDFARRVFTVREIEDCQASRRPEAAFTACFAVKEAVLKALGTGWGQAGRFREIETRWREADAFSGRVALCVSGHTAEAAARLGMIGSFQASVSCSAHCALAIVVIEGSRA